MGIETATVHPEHIDAFAAFLENYNSSARIMRQISAMLQEGVLYDYVEGELWLIAARMGRPEELAELVTTAAARGAHRNMSFSIRRGLLAFFMSCRKAGVYAEFRALKRFRAQTPFVQSLVVPYLTDVDFQPSGIIVEMTKDPSPLPGMTLAAHLVQRALSVGGLGISADQLAPQVRNVFQGLGLIPGQKPTTFDQVGELLRNRFGIVYWRKWKMLRCDDNYQHSLELLLSADARFLPDRSGWLSFQNSFNDAAFRAFMEYLSKKSCQALWLWLIQRASFTPSVG